jgi:hypothetical protein
MGSGDSEAVRKDPGKGDLDCLAFDGGLMDPPVEASGILAYQGIFSLKGCLRLGLGNTVTGEVLAVLIVPMKKHPPLPG